MNNCGNAPTAVMHQSNGFIQKPRPNARPISVCQKPQQLQPQQKQAANPSPCKTAPQPSPKPAEKSFGTSTPEHASTQTPSQNQQPQQPSPTDSPEWKRITVVGGAVPVSTGSRIVAADGVPYLRPLVEPRRIHSTHPSTATATTTTTTNNTQAPEESGFKRTIPRQHITQSHSPQQAHIIPETSSHIAPSPQHRRRTVSIGGGEGGVASAATTPPATNTATGGSGRGFGSARASMWQSPTKTPLSGDSLPIGGSMIVDPRRRVSPVSSPNSTPPTTPKSPKTTPTIIPQNATASVPSEEIAQSTDAGTSPPQKQQVRRWESSRPLESTALQPLRASAEEAGGGEAPLRMRVRGETPLHLLSKRKDPSAPKILKDLEREIRNMSKSASNTSGVAGHIWSSMLNSSGGAGAIVQSIRGGTPLVGSLDVKDELGQTPLYAAVGAKNLSAVKLLLPGSDVNCPNQDGWTPLHVACYQGDVEMIEYLLGNSTPDPNARTSDLSTPLHYLARHPPPVDGRGHDRYFSVMVQLLGKEGKVYGKISNNSSAVNKSGDTPLHHAVATSSVELVEWLLRHHAHINQLNKYKESAMHNAVRAGSVYVVEKLLEFGASIDQEGAYGTPRDIAVQTDNAALMALFVCGPDF